MSKIQTEILNGFFSELSGKKEIDDETLTKLKAFLLDDKKPKVNDLVSIFSGPEDEVP
ncbi:MAG: hypothetical protein ABTQ25_12665 [Nitrosomonas ureae]